MSDAAVILIFMILLSGGIASFFVVPMIRAHFRDERIMARGQVATARVISLSDTGSRVNDQPVATIELEVRPPGAAAFTATAQTVVTAINAMQFQPGKQVSVRYDPTNHSQVVIVGVSP